jgi:YidC/Oxa1 family membrane protein insertase
MTVEAKLTAGQATEHLVVSLGSTQDPAQIKSRSMFRGGGANHEWRPACYANEKLSTWSVKDLVGKRKEAGGEVGWFGFVYPYFLTAIAVEPHDESITCRASGGSPAGPMLVEAAFAPAVIVPGTVYHRSVAGYFGPKLKAKLDGIAEKVGWPSTGLEHSIELGWYGFLAGPLLRLLDFFHGLVGNWPLAIVLLTVSIKLATLYWTHKSMRSMKAMSRLKPQLDKLKEKYKDDKQRQQVETMNLFKAHGVNPLAGCLPMLLQMPIWFSLYRALSVAAELYHVPFLWMHDLTGPDPYFILPVFMTAMMFVQALMTPTTATGAQQKMLSYGMPVAFGAMSLFFPAGLTLYISTNSIITLLHHLYMRAEDRRIVAASLAVATVEDGGVAAVSDEDAGGDDDDAADGVVRVRKGPGKRRNRGGRGGRRR